MVLMQNVRKVYESSNTVALDNVSLTIDDGEFVFLVGPSGSGKTTLMKLITGEVRPTSGKVVVNDFDMGTIKRRKLPKMRRTLGVVFQDYRLIENTPCASWARPTVRSARACLTYWSWSAWKAARRECRVSSPAVSSSVSPSRALWSTARA